jgi:hypothetical protein
MPTGATERHVPTRVAQRCSRTAKVAAEVTGRPAWTAEAPARVSKGFTWSSHIHAEVSAGTGPRPEGRRACTAEVRPEIPRRRARPMKVAAEAGVRPTRSAEVPTEIRCGRSLTPEVPMEATIGCTRHLTWSTWPMEVPAQLGGRGSRGVRSWREPARTAVSGCWPGTTALLARRRPGTTTVLAGCQPGSTAAVRRRCRPGSTTAMRPGSWPGSRSWSPWRGVRDSKTQANGRKTQRVSSGTTDSGCDRDLRDQLLDIMTIHCVGKLTTLLTVLPLTNHTRRHL